MSEVKTNNAATKLNGGINNSVTSLVVNSATAFPTTGYFSIIIDTEIMIVTAVSGTTFTVKRGQEGTSAASHSSGALIVHDLTSRSFDALIAGPITDNGIEKGEDIWLMATHQSVDTNMYLLASVDGVNFQTIRKTSIYTQSYPTRDPSIIKYKGLYYLAFTNSGNTYFTIIVSKDLWNWTFLVNVDCSAAVGSVFHCWAPQFFYDPTDDSLTIFLSISHSSVDTNHQLYYTTPTASDLSTWAVPLVVSGATWPAASIDPCLVLIGSTYTMYFKDDTLHYIQYATSSVRTGSYTVQTSGNSLGFGINNEAPELHQIDSATWRLYYNNVSGLNSVQYYYRDTTSFPTGWGSANPVVAPFIPAHCGILRVQDVPTLRNITAAAISSSFHKGSQLLRTTNQSISSGSTNVVSFDSVAARDELGAYNNANPTKLVAPHSGWYILGSHCKWAAATGGKRISDIRINGSVFASSVSVASVADCNDPDVTLTMPIWLNVGDYYETSVFQNQGGAVNITAAQMFMLEM